jgi:hypothetical protein
MLLEIMVVVDVFVVLLQSSTLIVEYFLLPISRFGGDHDLLEGPGLAFVDWVDEPGLDDRDRLDGPSIGDPARRENPGLSEDGLPCLSLGKASNSLIPIGYPGQW